MTLKTKRFYFALLLTLLTLVAVACGAPEEVIATPDAASDANTSALAPAPTDVPALEPVDEPEVVEEVVAIEPTAYPVEDTTADAVLETLPDERVADEAYPAPDNDDLVFIPAYPVDEALESAPSESSAPSSAYPADESAAGSTLADRAPAPLNDLDGTNWAFLGFSVGSDMQMPLPETEIALGFMGNQINGNAGCNTFFGNYSVNGTDLFIGDVGLTRRACEEVIGQQETQFVEALQTATGYEFSAENLLIYYASGVLIFQPGAAPAFDGSTLNGSSWSLQFYTIQDMALAPAEGSEITLSFNIDTVSGNNGCNDFETTFTTEGNTITVDPVQRVLAPCDDAERETRAADFIRVLESVQTFERTESQLLIKYPDGDLLLTPVGLSSGPSAPAPIGLNPIQPATIDEFQVDVNNEAQTATVTLVGNYSDGCAKFSSVEQTLEGEREISFTMYIERPVDAICTQALVPFSETFDLNLDGLDSGTYRIYVNELEGEFTLDF